MAAVLGVDVGGTFTDVVFYDGGRVVSWKTPTTTPQSNGVLSGVRHFVSGAGFDLLHGTTVATNALLEGTGARVVLVTTPGFEGVIEIGRQSRPSLYDLSVDRPPALVEPGLRVGHEEDATTLAFVGDARPDAIAVALLGSYRDATEESRLAGLLQSSFPGVSVSVGSNVSPGFREFERVSTTVIDAYLSPRVSGYLDALLEEVPASSASVMTSSGGLAPFSSARHAVGQLTLSGPAAGVVAADVLRRAHGLSSLITFDMGGTSTDVARIGPEGVTLSSSQVIGGRVNRVPSMPIHTVGAGGGSIAWVDPGGALRVGPASAGADPGPACYGRGGNRPTVTDANLYLGLIPDTTAFSGSLRLDRDLAGEALADLGAQVGLGARETASGIIRIVDAHMSRAIRQVSVEEGFDPREASLVAFGGAGGLHAARLARELAMTSVIVPPHTGAFSALGLLLARPRVEEMATVLADAGSPDVVAAVGKVARKATDEYEARLGDAPQAVATYVDARYESQAHELTIPFREGGVREDFVAEHRRRFGFDLGGATVEVVNVRAVASGSPPLSWGAIVGHGKPEVSDPGQTRMLLDGRDVDATVWDRGGLGVGMTVSGPSVVVDGTSSVLLTEGETALVCDDGSLQVTW